MRNLINIINLDELYAVLQAIRYARPLPQTSLYNYLMKQNIIANDLPHQLQDYYLTAWLSNIITTQYNSHRQYHGLIKLSATMPKSGLICHIRDDYRLSHPELEAWSVIFIRYVCLNANITTHEHKTIAQASDRTLRRRQRQGVKQVYLEILIS